MALHNFTSPFLATPGPLNPFFHHHQQPPVPTVPPYSYPRPQKPFLAEEFPGDRGRRPPPAHDHRGGDYRTSHVPGYTRVDDDDGTNTRVHAVIDYDYDDGDDEAPGVPATPIQGPIYVKNGSVPVVPLYSHPVINNGTFVQIPILWTALSVALGLELRGEYIRGVPCIKRNQQLICPTAGDSYPLDRIELFIDENKALMKRMYGEIDMQQSFSSSGPYPPPSSGKKTKRSAKTHLDPGPDPGGDDRSDPGKPRTPRQNFRNNNNMGNESGRIDVCESKLEIVTPYWASNSAGKIRAIVNTQHFEQAVHQETCSKASTKRCSGECGCEQKYKWHRLLAYDPDNDCKGIFMDWFLFPSCCVCRCNP
ncbi:protein spaetzle 3 [Cylas formicarius]|uniref:protein spaetzle 3 n=1 Tax=Cylas formicarius TaxID=197179 RepID=UPI002958592C|nr:protein spaetzle 3 [Cylas formicarius]